MFNRGAMCSVRETDGGFSVPLAYAMYYVWGTRMLAGKFEYEFALYPFNSSWSEANLHRKALEYSYPCRVTAGEPGNGWMGRRVAPFDIQSDDVAVSALYPKGGNAFLRLYEHRGGMAAVQLRCAEGQRQFLETDLAGRPGTAVAMPLSFRPWQIRTLMLGK